MSLTTLATDLDGTFIPISNSQEQTSALDSVKQTLETRRLSLVFVTGRSFQLTLEAMEQYGLPNPDSIICDVGSRVLDRRDDGSYRDDREFVHELNERQQGWTNDQITTELIDRLPILSPQPQSNQTQFKCSFDFPATSIAEVDERVCEWIRMSRAPLTRTMSVDPETEIGLLDLLPKGVDKAFGLTWWADREARSVTTIVFCGDSGNDSAALSSGVNAVLVGNADDQVRRETRESVADMSLLFEASLPGPQGVLQGLDYHLARAGSLH